MPTPSLYADFEKLLAEVPAALPKTAHENVGGGEPKGQGATGSDTTSPTKSVPNDANPEKLTDGSFAQQLSKEIKDMGPGSIDALPDATPTDPNSIQGSVNLKQTTVGHDPALEDDYGSTLKEPGVGTSTNAKFDDGQKYASVPEFLKLASPDRGNYLTKLANELLASIATAAGVQPKTAGAAEGSAIPQGTPAGTPGTAAVPKTAAEGTPEAAALLAEAQAGYELARVLGMEKMSADQRAQATIGGTISDGFADAELVAAWLQKSASEMPSDHGDEEGGGGEEKPKKPEADASAAGGTTGDEGGGDASGGAPAAPGGGGGDPVAEAAASQFGGDAGGAPAGGPPGGGGDPAAQGGLDGGGQVSREELLQGLLIAMQELNITPEEVMQAAQAGGGAPGGAPGGMPGGAPGGAPGGGMPPGAGMPPAPAGMAPGGDPMGGGMPPKMAATLCKMAAAARQFQREGKFQLAAPSNKRARQIADRSKSMLMELRIN